MPCPLLNGSTVVQQPIQYAQLTGRYVEAALEFIQRAESGKTPFFLYLAFGHTHAWNFASEQYWNKSDRGHYGDALLEMDAALANVTDILRPRGSEISGSTLVFWTSDNGAIRRFSDISKSHPSLLSCWLSNTRLNSLLSVHWAGAAWPHRFEHAGSTGPFRCGKGTAWDGGVRVPAIAWWPGVIKPATVSMAPLSSLDIFPTFISLASATTTVSAGSTAGSVLDSAINVLDGLDLSTFILSSGAASSLPGGGDAYSRTRSLFWYYADQLAAARVGRYKVHWLHQGWGRSWIPFPECGPENATRLARPELYAIERDPSERFPIDPGTDEWKDAMAMVMAAVDAQKRSLAVVGAVAPPELDAEVNQSAMLCCAGHSPEPPFDMCKCNNMSVVAAK